MAGVKMSLPINTRLNVFNVLGLTIASIGKIPTDSERCDKLITSGTGYQYESQYFIGGEQLVGAVLINKIDKAGILASFIEMSISNPMAQPIPDSSFNLQTWLRESIANVHKYGRRNLADACNGNIPRIGAKSITNSKGGK